MNYKIEYILIEKLKVNPENPRFIRDVNFKSLVKSLADCPTLFDARPCLCSDRTGELIILAGNMRFLAAKELGYKEIPIIIMPGLTEIQEREILIKDNGNAWGEWDFDLLSGWDDLPLVDWGIKMNKFEVDDPNKEWEGMPEFEQEDKSAYRAIHVNFATEKDVQDFADLIGQGITEKTRSIWHPKAEKINMKDVYKDES